MDENLQVEEQTETKIVSEEVDSDKKQFLKGAISGALVMLLICAIIGGTVAIIASSRNKTPIVSENDAEEESIISDETIKKLEEIQAYIDQFYLYPDKIDLDVLQDAIVKGYVNGLQEPYSVYYDADETRSLYETTSGTFGGIGVGIQMDLTSGLATFTTIYPDTPGEKGGFKVGDIVYKVNGEDISGMDLDTIVSKIRGEVGTEVELTVIRDGDEYTAKVTRALIENDTVNYELKSGKVGYIQVTGFEAVTYEQFKEALEDLNKQGMKSLVIDLRSNPGGNLSTVCQMCDLILPEGEVVSIKDKNGKGQSYTSNKETLLNVPLVVLVNGYSASASEIFAGAVQDFGVGTIVGTTTYGKGIVQNVYQLSDGTCLKITCSEYFTAKGRNIHGVGIKPDVEVEYKYDEANPTYDNQLEKALELLKNKK